MAGPEGPRGKTVPAACFYAEVIFVMPILGELAVILILCLLCEGIAVLLPFPFPAAY